MKLAHYQIARSAKARNVKPGGAKSRSVKTRNTKPKRLENPRP